MRPLLIGLVLAFLAYHVSKATTEGWMATKRSSQYTAANLVPMLRAEAEATNRNLPRDMLDGTVRLLNVSVSPDAVVNYNYTLPLVRFSDLDKRGIASFSAATADTLLKGCKALLPTMNLGAQYFFNYHSADNVSIARLRVTKEICLGFHDALQ